MRSYLAEHQLLRRPCAVKLIRLDRAGDASSLHASSARCRRWPPSRHWNTVEIYDYGHAEDGTFYYVMEYLPGLDLQIAGGPPRSAAGRAYGPPAAAGMRALHEVHANGLVHRDIKPSNVIVCERGGAYDVVKFARLRPGDVSPFIGRRPNLTRERNHRRHAVVHVPGTGSREGQPRRP